MTFKLGAIQEHPPQHRTLSLAHCAPLPPRSATSGSALVDGNSGNRAYLITLY